MTEAERERLLAEGATGQGMAVCSEAAAGDHRLSQVRLSVSFKDGKTVQFSGETVEFSEELANLYQPTPGSPEARRLAEVREPRSCATRTGYPRSSFPCPSASGCPFATMPRTAAR
jgi:hypothetical protein